MMSPEQMNAVATEVLERCTLHDGALVLDDAAFTAFGQRIQQAGDDKRGWGVALIALCNRLRGIPGAGAAAERVLALAAIALGDHELNVLMAQQKA
jgi:hypothetical protein